PIVINAQRILGRLQNPICDRWSSFFIGANVVVEFIGLTGHTEIERADLAQEPVQILSSDRICDEVRWASFSEELTAGGGRGEIFDAYSPVAAPVTARAASQRE